MTNWVTKTNLLLILASLLTVKFLVIPVVDWQSKKVRELELKSIKLHKMSSVASDQEHYESSLSEAREYFLKLDEYFYYDDDDTKLTIQRQVEDVFSRNSLSVNGFNWIADEGGRIRTVRSTVFFEGATTNMMSAFWELSSLPQIIRQVQWNQQIKDRGKSFGGTSGNVTLEFYAWKGLEGGNLNTEIASHGFPSDDIMVMIDD